MPSAGRQTLLSTLDVAELEAQRVACSYLVKGCERALFDFGLVAGETANAEAAHVDQRAVDIMRSVLSSWRDTLSQLPAPSGTRARIPGWMVNQSPPGQDSAIRRQPE